MACQFFWNMENEFTHQEAVAGCQNLKAELSTFPIEKGKKSIPVSQQKYLILFLINHQVPLIWIELTHTLFQNTWLGENIDYEELGSGELENYESIMNCLELNREGLTEYVDCNKKNYVLCERLIMKTTNVTRNPIVDEQFCKYFDNQIEEVFLLKETVSNTKGQIPNSTEGTPDEFIDLGLIQGIYLKLQMISI